MKRSKDHTPVAQAMLDLSEVQTKLEVAAQLAVPLREVEMLRLASLIATASAALQTAINAAKDALDGAPAR